MRHYVRKAHEHELNEVAKYPLTITNTELEEILLSDEECIVLDVREAAEFAFGHIPSAVSVPLGGFRQCSFRSDEANLCCLPNW